MADPSDLGHGKKFNLPHLLDSVRALTGWIGSVKSHWLTIRPFTLHYIISTLYTLYTIQPSLDYTQYSQYNPPARQHETHISATKNFFPGSCPRLPQPARPIFHFYSATHTKGLNFSSHKGLCWRDLSTFYYKAACQIFHARTRETM